MEFPGIERTPAVIHTALAAHKMETREETKELIRAVKKVNEAEKFGEGSELTFLLDRETGKPIIRIVDKKTGELIRQIPQETVLRMAEEVKVRR